MSLVSAKEQTRINVTLEDYYHWLSGFQPLMAKTMLSIIEHINDFLKERTVYCHTSHEAIVLQTGPEIISSELIIRIQCQPSDYTKLMIMSYILRESEFSDGIIGQNLDVKECLKIVSDYLMIESSN
ncbi:MULTISPECIES: hypothetical protein [Flavobacterium]|uniref:Uncharacterized protein n=1 Tax=Flavobacterium jumunjinense TaxID=998845 RepID=A0ABV5GJ56_9FLAO|nr:MULTISPECIES: hypothetical protein [Flavobacterium]